MASVIRQKTDNGIRYFIQLSPSEKESRPKISLGKITKRQALTAKTNIEELVKSKNTGATIPPAVQEWLAGITDGLRKRLEALSIIEHQNSVADFAVAEWVEKYIGKRPDVKETTRGKWQDVKNKLSAFFKAETLDKVTVQHAKGFRVYLQTVVGLAENSIRRNIGITRQFFNAAIDAGLIDKNPFKGQSVSVRANPTRFYYVQPETAYKVLDACPDVQWRLIFGLARWGGLRCPSEVLRLQWQDIDFEHKRFIVHASKTEHHADSGIRIVPMFPELRPLFQDAFDNANEGDVYCITKYRDSRVNLRTTFYKIIMRAGFEPWPKPFQNCRSTRETELFKLTNGNIKAVCNWIGNCPEVAMRHYAQVTESDLQEASKMSLLNDAEKRVHNTVQTTAEMRRTESHEPQNKPVINPCNYESKREFAMQCENVQKLKTLACRDSNPD